MLLTTTDIKADYEVLGIVRGSKVKAVHLGKDIKAFLKNLIGGDISDYTELMEKAREGAMQEMIKEAEKLGANAIIGIKFSSAQIASGCAEMLVYGTAVKI
ncbi:hypothetical protein H0A61_00500 [Koleobacter methoxysyntrophicus]|jgi:uncharacterized protein YbjQ (UPF0145 family)|uniref:UPF0145 protein H0A61_00500 n=1 Tax=Koleobacter methoxysyntrophicus TaxID=2751313 RepID=A0A8A0RKL8_9FIRM|nr:YbjQ family protein [Koleobacter methoxysyntrophicus]NPV43614.1 YbjQ family protein [Bacillota bacterium]QSQ08180.1 hypothetical protein H0A61_00500 [Koleobacter methoxysyntrophicus]